MIAAMQNDQHEARRVLIRGIVQGVGFRPFVFRAATRHGVCGWVLNGAAGVEVHAEGAAERIAAFLDELQSEPPAAARISHFDVSRVTPEGAASFQIRASHRDETPTALISPDLAVCADCLREVQDSGDRRHQYPYINCTNCGPRFSIVVRLPYDRANTTMGAWPLCDQCRAEFENPLDRRYHAQPIACGRCGPNYNLTHGDERIETAENAIRRAAELLCEGAIVAVKGIGGYHLACDARNAAAVEALRTRKFRKEKPFALMVATLEQARSIVELSEAHEPLLLESARPIVLAPAKVALPGVAPDNAALGVVLPYTPLHYLLFAHGAPSPLVLTSANRSSEPIAFRDDAAKAQLAGIADAFLTGERPIARRMDDSVVAVRKGKPFMIRRARGYAPAPVARLPTGGPIFAVGSDLKNAVALAVDGEVFMSQHIGDLGDAETDEAFGEAVRDLLAMYDIDPEHLTVVHDLHPEFRSTRYALALPARRTIAVQHHHAHIASVLAEHGLLDERVVGVSLDGTGYGIDGTIWGGEFFVGSVRGGFERSASLRPVRMPGGDAAARFPVQAAAGFLHEMAGLPDMNQPPFYFPPRFFAARDLLAKDVRSFVSTSAGRLFDAVAAILGFTRESTFEGQAAMWLEDQAHARWPQSPYPFAELDHRPLMQAIVDDRLAGRDPREIAAAFHAALAEGVARQIKRLCRQNDVSAVALSGGVFQNELLLHAVFNETEDMRGVRVFTNERVPVNDGGIALGQAVFAAV